MPPKFETMLILIIPQVVELITKNFSIGELTAIREFYNSKVYSALEQEEA